MTLKSMASFLLLEKIHQYFECDTLCIIGNGSPTSIGTAVLWTHVLVQRWRSRTYAVLYTTQYQQQSQTLHSKSLQLFPLLNPFWVYRACQITITNRFGIIYIL